MTPPTGVVLTEAGKVLAGRYSYADRIRSVRGRPQKIGGWVRQVSRARSGTLRANCSCAHSAVILRSGRRDRGCDRAGD
jgi:hypothetical protein